MRNCNLSPFDFVANWQGDPRRRILRLSRFLAAGTLLGLAIVYFAIRSEPAEIPRLVTTGRGIAVVELFTSEGCSSCPPADKVLADIAEAAERDGTTVFPLSFHVDYWNHLGWSDPYSRPEFSSRQSEYANIFGSNRVYTPQMVVNGTTEFNGADRGRAYRAIQQALSHPAALRLTLALKTAGADTLEVDYALSDLTPGMLLHVAFAERARMSSVSSGENSGTNLRHSNVVRIFETIKPQRQGCVILKGLIGLQREKASIVAYVQDPRSGRILGAGIVRL